MSETSICQPKGMLRPVSCCSSLAKMLIPHAARDAGGATALIASVAKPLPRWAGFILVPCVTLSSVSAMCLHSYWPRIINCGRSHAGGRDNRYWLDSHA